MRRRQSLEQQMREDAGLGIDKRDAYWWLPWETDFELIEALVAFDQFRNLEPLKELLCRGRPPGSRRFVDDFFDRHPPRKKRGKQRTPAYDRSDAMRTLLGGVEQIKYLRAEGVSLKDAIDRVASGGSLKKRTLRNAIEGRIAAVRRGRR
jgi:hypothetical protein